MGTARVCKYSEGNVSERAEVYRSTYVLGEC